MALFTATHGLAAGPGVDVVRTAMAEVDAHYLYADSPGWARGRKALLAAPPDDDDRQHALLRSVFAELGDPDLHLLSGEEFAALQAETAGKQLGTGLIDFSIDRAPTGEARVVTTLDDSPARRAGVRPGDVLMSIDDVPTRGVDHETIVDRLRVSKAVTLSLRRGGRTLKLTIVPSQEPLRAVTYEVRGAPGATVGYIRVAQFTPDAAAQVREALAALHDREAGGYILDLRDNPGGLLNVAVEIAGLFREGSLGAMVRRDGTIQIVHANAPPIIDAPLVVLINEAAASAAEFVAGELQGLPEVRLVGRPTRGRGQAQTYVALDHGWGIVIPTARLRSRQGTDLKDHPLRPDILVPDAPSGDAVYDRGLSVLLGLSKPPARLEN